MVGAYAGDCLWPSQLRCRQTKIEGESVNQEKFISASASEGGSASARASRTASGRV